MKRKIQMTLGLLLALSLTAVPAKAVTKNTALEAVQALGIINGDDTGSLNLQKPVTRAEFTKMMAAASTYKDSIGTGSGVSLFSDVKSSHWAGRYIQLATEQGWMMGYIDGTFRPEGQITLEEGCTALLRMLGYDASTFFGSYPEAQLTKADAVGLRDDITAVRGEVLTREDCVSLLYNLLVSENASGAVYGTTLGYTVTNGEVDYSTLVTAETKGPYIAQGGESLPIHAVSVYQNGKKTDKTKLDQYDVYYYNENLQSVWIYTEKITGTLTAVAPNGAAPTSVTVGGNTYTLGSSSASFAVSTQGEFSSGSLVSLLLGMNGEVVDVVAATEAAGVYYGVVTSYEKAVTDSGSDTESLKTAITLACTDGVERTFYVTGYSSGTGKLLSITVGENGTTMKYLSEKHLSGTISKDGTTFGDLTFAENVEILDTNGEGSFKRIYPSRLAGETLKSEDVVYYTLNEAGKIDRLILEDVTGDLESYIYITSAESVVNGLNISGTYTYYEDGVKKTITGSTAYLISSGGGIAVYEDGQLKSLRQMESATATAIDALTLMEGNQKHLIAEDCEVYIKDGGTLYAASLSDLNTQQYELKGWYDNEGFSAGNRIRIIIAEKTGS